jgi:predicted dehydrogenase
LRGILIIREAAEAIMLKVALVGCGLVADQHVAQIRRIHGANLVGVCDTEPLMARQLADRFQVPQHFTDVAEMLRICRPDVVHITTPAQTHFPLGRLCLEAGSHVYMEKPFTIDAPQAEELLRLAASRRRTMTVGHNLQFSPETIRMRELVKAGFLGGSPVHIECVQCFSHEDPTYGKALLGNRTHWIRSLPGSLLQNLISHGIAKIAEYLSHDRFTVLAHVYSSPYLRQLGQTDLVDELRAIITDEAGTTAMFTFSTQIGTAANHICLYGSEATVIADTGNRMLVPLRPIRFKSYLRYFLGPRVIAKAYRKNSWHNIWQFLKKDFHTDSGMKTLIEKFYRSINEGTAPPIPYREILTTVRIMDAIFSQIPAAGARTEPLVAGR